MFDDAYQAGTDQALSDLARRPNTPRPQAPKFSMWGLVRGAARGVPAGAAEAVGSTADILGAFGDVLGATGASAGGMFALQSEQERQQSDDAAQRIRDEGVDFRQEAGGLFRGVAKSYMPDPVTAHGAEIAVAEFSRIASKAIPAALALGPIGGAVISGAEEGFTASDKLAEQGVDLGTRSAVGGVTAAVQALTFGLPVAGKTAAGTAALALGGGTGGFVAQQLATREILAGADYSKLADQYDPFDPVGLALSTILPLGFGALAMRGAARSQAARAAEDAAAADAALIASPEPPGGRTAIAAAVDEAVVDAARVNLLREHFQATRLTDDVPGAARDDAALRQAIDQLAAGERVDVAPVAALDTPRAFEAAAMMGERLRAVADEMDALPVRGADAPRVAEPVAADAPPATPEPTQPRPAGEAPAPGRLQSEDPVLDSQMLVLEQQRPDLPVRLDGMDEAVPLSELMTRLRAEVDAEVAEIDLVQVAAECAIRSLGAGA